MTYTATKTSLIVMQIMHFLSVENSCTASHYEFTLQQKIGLVGLRMSHKKQWSTKGLMAGIQLVSQWEELYMR